VILAIDTSIGTSVALLDADGTLLAERASADPRGHAEAIGLLLSSLFRRIGGDEDVLHAYPPILLKNEGVAGVEGVTAVVVGMGPGPFTGLRVGIAAARAFAAGSGVPVWPVLSHDAVAAEAVGSTGEDAMSGRSRDAGVRGTGFAVVTDAKRREHYLTRYAGVEDGVPRRIGEPELVRFEALEALGEDTIRPVAVSAAQLGRVALRRRALGLATGPEQPQYLREPDVTPSAAPKRVS